MDSFHVGHANFMVVLARPTDNLKVVRCHFGSALSPTLVKVDTRPIDSFLAGSILEIPMALCVDQVNPPERAFRELSRLRHLSRFFCNDKNWSGAIVVEFIQVKSQELKSMRNCLIHFRLAPEAFSGCWTPYFRGGNFRFLLPWGVMTEGTPGM